MTACLCLYATLAAATGSTYVQGYATMVPDLHTTEYVAGIGLASWSLGFGLTPLVTSSLSEEFGRTPIYVVSAAGFTLTYAMVAL
jgi:MFS family permease